MPIDVGMAEHDGVDIAGRKRKILVALKGLGSFALEEAAIEQDLLPAGFDEMHRAGDGAGGAPEGDGCGIHGICQSSSGKPGTRLNSAVL